MPSQWRALPRAERTEMLAFDWLRDEQRRRLLDELAEAPAGFGLLARLMVILQD